MQRMLGGSVQSISQHYSRVVLEVPVWSISPFVNFSLSVPDAAFTPWYYLGGYFTRQNMGLRYRAIGDQPLQCRQLWCGRKPF